ncbi:hypothetical protein [Streptococcus thoraltensis]|uniref:hypothetical protein n=1 Tax=Streptococcus thoraltensis TaxID=55085 RepID=UPI001F595AC6|nr:hypothetical protein [Streptococcus thoraltensis]
MHEVIEEIPGKLFLLIIYLVIFSVDILKLSNFNQNYGHYENYWDVMTVEGGIAWKLLAFSFLIALFSIFLIYLNAIDFRRVGGYSKIAIVIMIVVLFVSLIVLYHFVDNPILRAAIAVLFFGGIMVTAFADSSTYY